MTAVNMKPSKAFVGASWLALAAGASAYLVGLWNADMLLNEKGYYLTILLLGLFSVVSLQKTIRDKVEDIPTTHMYFLLCWFAVLASIGLLAVGLVNANLVLSEKGFYAMAFILSLFAAVAAQKNVRDLAADPSTATQKIKQAKPIVPSTSATNTGN